MVPSCHRFRARGGGVDLARGAAAATGHQDVRGGRRSTGARCGGAFHANGCGRSSCAASHEMHALSCWAGSATREGRQAMGRGSPLESARALKTALGAWSLASLLLSVVLVGVDYFVTDKFWSLALSSLASAGFSIVGALLITELILKPLYVRDVLQTANLSSEVHHAGIKGVRGLSEVDWRQACVGELPISVAVGNEHLLRGGPWPAILEASRAKKRTVKIHVLDGPSAEPLAQSLESQWRSNGCKEKGSEIVVVPHDRITQGLILQCGEWIVASLADDPGNDTPLFIVFSSDSRESVVTSLKRGIDRLDESDSVPLAGAGA
ncbi:hypothetical protein FB381_4313 [Nocardioides albertanoniae]|uniref:Uncharacterized protein n=1 Tax=Nocardioides albertanoniae TaxID=1175486 RepID=A0A543ACS4_9ACTN|nr:hypothetical protein FB381_4313 [Nocardioides albertanoniae]